MRGMSEAGSGRSCTPHPIGSFRVALSPTGCWTSTETAYCLLSTALSAARFGDVARAHWSVENGLHWVLDVSMSEDQACNHKDHGPRNIALLRRLALDLAKVEGSKESMKGKLYRAALSETFLTRLAQFGKTQMR